MGFVLSARSWVSKWLAGIAILGGLGLGAGGLGSGAAYLLLALLASEATFPLASVATIASLAALGLGLGVPLVWYGLRAWRGAPAAPFRPPPAAGLALVFIGAVAAGQGVLCFGFAPRFLFPPLHVLAGALPALTVLAYTGRRLGLAARQREIVGLAASSVLIGGLGSIVLVGLAGLGLIFFGAVLVALTPGGLETLRTLTLHLQDPAWGGDANNLLALILTPVGLVIILLLGGVIGPLIEELLKPVGILFIPRRLERAEAFLWGVAAASGFAATEGMFNSVVNLDAWLPVVLMRVGTSLMHCLAGGLVGLGWYVLRSTRRPWRAMGLYLLAISFHSAWNVITLGIGGLALWGAAGGEAMAGLGVVLLLGVLGLLFLTCVVALVGLVRWLRIDLPDQTAVVSTESLIATEG